MRELFNRLLTLLNIFNAIYAIDIVPNLLPHVRTADYVAHPELWRCLIDVQPFFLVVDFEVLIGLPVSRVLAQWLAISSLLDSQTGLLFGLVDLSFAASRGGGVLDVFETRLFKDALSLEAALAWALALTTTRLIVWAAMPCFDLFLEVDNGYLIHIVSLHMRFHRRESGPALLFQHRSVVMHSVLWLPAAISCH